MSGNYKLYYFDIKARGEEARLLFTLAKVPFEDVRIPYTPGQPGVIPPEIKQKLTYGQVPFLEFDDGQGIAQTSAISRFLARRFGFYGENDVEAAKIDEIMEGLRDFGDSMRPVWLAKGDEEKAAALKNVSDVAAPKFLDIFAKLLDKNGGEYFVGNKWTLADVNFYRGFKTAEEIFKLNLVENYPKLKNLIQRFEAIPQIATYLENRPKTAF